MEFFPLVSASDFLSFLSSQVFPVVSLNFSEIPPFINIFTQEIGL